MAKRSFILTNKNTFSSAKILRDELEKVYKEKYLVTKKENKKSYFLRFGNSFGNYSGEINSPEIIKLMSNKKLFSEFLLNEGFLTPEFNKNTDILEFPCIIRENLSLSKGKGIHVVENEKDFFNIWKNNYYWTKFINFKFEVRAHVVGGDLKKLFIKKWVKNEQPKYPIKNSISCKYILQDISNENRYRKIKNIINKLKNLLGEKNFYALDMGFSEEKSNYYIIEGNTAPGLNEKTAKIYAETLKELL